jgi:hypothetical protein
MNELISILELHYENPYLWDEADGSSLFGPITDITKELADAMERRHPGYRVHICAIAIEKGITAELFR